MDRPRLKMLVPKEADVQHSDNKDCWCEPIPALAVESEKGLTVTRYDPDVNAFLMPNEYIMWFHKPKGAYPPIMNSIWEINDD